MITNEQPDIRHTTRADYTAGLRALADKLDLDKNQILPVPYAVSLCIGVTNGADRVWVDLTRVAAALAAPIVEDHGVHAVTARFGALTFRVAVCSEATAARHSGSDPHGGAA